MERRNAEEMYDLSTISRDNLRFLLNTAKKEWEPYVNNKEMIENCEKNIEEGNKSARRNRGGNGFLIASSIITLSGLIMIIKSDNINLGGLGLLIPILALAIGGIDSKIKYKAAQTMIKECEARLPELKEKNDKAISEFKAVLLIPDEYCYVYALSTMLKFIDNKRADNWKEVSGLYEEHLHRLSIQENARITAENSRLQADYAKQNRNASRMAAAGAWAAAAGIWRR